MTAPTWGMCRDGRLALVLKNVLDLPGAVWQRRRTHYTANLSITPKSLWPAVKAMLYSVYDQPDAASAQAQFNRLLDYVTDKLPARITERYTTTGDLARLSATWPKACLGANARQIRKLNPTVDAGISKSREAAQRHIRESSRRIAAKQEGGRRRPVATAPCKHLGGSRPSPRWPRHV